VSDVDPVGQWDEHHGALIEPKAYGRSSYLVIGEWAQGLDVLEDWGCGGGALRSFVPPEVAYVGVDGSKSPFASVRADLAKYHSHASGIVLRHVLEHNDHWQAVLANAIESFTDRLMIVLFTPTVESTRVMFREPDYGNVPVIAFRLGDLLAEIPSSPALQYTVEQDVPSPDTAFGVETFISAWRH